VQNAVHVHACHAKMAKLLEQHDKMLNSWLHCQINGSTKS